MRRSLVTFATTLLLWVLVAQVNHSLSGFRIYLFVGSLYVVYAGLMLPWRGGLAAVILAGLLCDANAPVEANGTHMILFTAAFAVLWQIRGRLPREDLVARIIVALLTNLALFLLFSFTQIGHSPVPAIAWPRLLADLMCSQIFLTLIAPWFFALQHHALMLARVEREAIDEP